MSNVLDEIVEGLEPLSGMFGDGGIEDAGAAWRWISERPVFARRSLMNAAAK